MTIFDAELSAIGDAEYQPIAQTEQSVVLRLGDKWLALDDWANGWIVTAVDMGAPVSREATYASPGGDGTVDNTARVGGRNVILAVSLVGSNPQALLDMLAPYLAQRARPTLEVATVLGEARRSLLVRHTGDMDVKWERPGLLDVTIGFRSVGTPYWQGPKKVATAWPDEATPGRAFPFTFPLSFPSAAGIGAALIKTTGTVDTTWVARIFGPITAPEIILAATGERVVFKTTLTVGAGDYLTVDSGNRTALLNGLVGSPRYTHLNFPATDWFRLAPGDQSIRLFGTGTNTSTQAEITWKDAFL